MHRISQTPSAKLQARFHPTIESNLAISLHMRNTAVLLIDCPDRKGLVAGVANLLYRYGANITHADQHQDHEAGLFFMRVEWELEGFDLTAFRAEFQATARELQMQWRLTLMSDVPR